MTTPTIPTLTKYSTREQIMEFLTKEHGCVVKTTEDMGYNEGGIHILSSEEQVHLFDYWSEKHEYYEAGISKVLINDLLPTIYFFQWYDCGTVQIWEV